MKKLIALLLIASLGLAVVGCKGSSDDSGSGAATTSKIKDKTPNAGGDE